MLPAEERAGHRRRPWSDLPHNLLTTILVRLTAAVPCPALRERASFRGVCQAWRAAELAHPRPPMPWLVAPGYCVSLHEAAIYRVPLPEDAAAAICRGSFGDWLALVPLVSGRPFLLNAFTKERIMLPRRTKKPMVKLVLSSAPDSKACTVAAIVAINHTEYAGRYKIVVCHLRSGRRQERSWQTLTAPIELQDIIFFEGKLHTLDSAARLHVFKEDELQQLPDEPWGSPRPKRRFYRVRLHLLILHGKLHMVGRGLGRTRWMHFTRAVGAFALVSDGETPKRPEPVKDFEGHAIFVGDAFCDAFPMDAAASGRSKIRDNQICFVDEEKNMSLLAAHGRRPFRQLQSYDVRKDCVRAYEPSSSTETWRCLTAQRFPHRSSIGPPRLAPLSGAELLLWNVANCLGAMYPPSYTTRKEDDGASVFVTVEFQLRPGKIESFTQHQASAKKAKEATAHEAVTFLRSRFRSILDDSPWSSVPHYHSHVDEDEYILDNNSYRGNYEFRDLFDSKDWYNR